MKALYFIWSFIERFGANVLSFVGNIVLAYMLLPHDFGLMAMVSLFTGLIVVLVDAGTGDALLQRGNPSRRDFNTVFFFNVAVSVALAAVYAAIALPVARFFNAPEIENIMPALGVAAILYGLTVTQYTRLRSQLKFKTVAVINISAVVCSIIAAVLVAMNGGGYWALVTLQIGHPLASLILLSVFSKWELRWEFDKVSFRQIWAFSVNLLVSTFFNLLSQYIFPMILGWKYNATQAGYMGQAQKLQQTPVNSIETSISLTSFVIIAKEKTHEAKCAQVKRMFDIMTMINTFICMVFIALSRPIIEVIFPEQWLPTIPYLRLLAVWALVYPVCNHAIVIYKLFDRTSVIRNVFIIEKSAIVVAALLLYRLGIPAIIFAATALSTISLIIYMVMANSVMGQGTAAKLAFYYLKNLLCAGIIAAISYFMTMLVYGDNDKSTFSVSLIALLAGTIPFVVYALLKSYNIQKNRGT